MSLPQSDLCRLLVLLAGMLALPLIRAAAPTDDPALRLELKGPVDRWDEAVPLGNGLTGGLLWGQGGQIRLSLDRGGLWDNRPHPLTTEETWDYAHLKQWVAEGNQREISGHFDACYNTEMHPTKIPGGRLVVDLPEGVAAGDFALDMREAMGIADLGAAGQARFLFSATRPVAAAALPVKGIKLGFRRPESLDKLGYPAPEFGEGDGLFWMVQATVADGRYAVVVGSRETESGTELAVTIASSQDGGNPLELGRKRVRDALDLGFDTVARDHTNWWAQWWAGSSVTIPDLSLQRHYYLVKYFHAAASRKESPPMPLQGVWTADTGGLPPWKGDYHHDLNTQTTYLAYPVAGLFDEGLSFLDYNVELLPQYRKFAREFYGLDRGAVVPGVADFKGQPLGGWAMYSLSPTHGAWIVQLSRRHWKMTADGDFLRTKAWPFTREIAQALLALCREDVNGHLKLPLSSSPEIHDNSLRAWLKPNSNYDLAMLKMAFDTAGEMAAAMGEPDQAETFRRAAGQLEPWHVDDRGVLMFAAGEPFNQSHRHHSHMMAIHPFNQLTIEDGPEVRRIIDATLDEVEKRGTQAWVGYSFSWYACIAARAARADTALQYLKWYEWCTLRNGFHVNGQQRGPESISGFKYRPFTLEGNFLAMEAIQEMLLQSWGGKVRIFPATPAAWAEASFRDLRAEGGFKVSASRRGGQTRSVSITATVDQTLTLRDPFPGAQATWNLPMARDGDEWSIAMKAGQRLEGSRTELRTETGSPATTPMDGADLLSLAGPWKVRIDEADQGLAGQWFAQPLSTADLASLPGSLAESGLGHRFDPESGRYGGLPHPPYLKWPSAGYTDAHRRDELGVLVAERMTYGPAWFERTIEIPRAWSDRDLRLTLERVKWGSQLWIDGRPVQGPVTDSLHTPHLYDLGSLAPGPHRLTLRLDNRPQVHIGVAGHGYGMETEPLWLGAVGELKLFPLDSLRIERVTVTPAPDLKGATFHFALAGAAPRENTRLSCRLIDPETGRVIGCLGKTLPTSENALALALNFTGPAEGWDEFHPKLYRLQWTLANGNTILHRGEERVGLRIIRRQGNRITLNGAPLFLRGNLDCAIHPDSQTPPTDRAWWERVLRIHKEAGFNHIRFHTWCPPEAAFDVADELGLYFQVETAYWVDDWVAGTPPFPDPFGKSAKTDAWVEAESLRIIRAYEHHPSFAMFCLGNEFGNSQSDWTKLQSLTATLNQATDHALVSTTTARKTVSADEFWVTHHSGAGTRGLGPPHTDWDFSPAVRATDKPVISHETGQRPSWPDYAALGPRFRGVMEPWNLRRLQTRAEEAGCADHRPRAEASARFALVQYKSEHEAMRRTQGLAGYQLLMLHDFTGQGEAHVGLLDPFFHEKPGITLETIRAWNGPTVPLARFERYTWSNQDTFRAHFQVAHEGPGTLAGVTPRWQLTTTSGRVLGEGDLARRDVPDHALTDLGTIEVPLGSLPHAAALRLHLEVGGARNEWNLWVYPAANREADPTPASANLHLTRILDEEAQARLAGGATVVLLPHGTTVPGARRLTWASTYWTGAWGWGNGMGLLLDPAHPALSGFPTEAHSDWQWHELAQGALGISLPPQFANEAMIVEQLADFHKPAREGCLFETRVGPGKLLVCSMDLTSNLEERHAARALRASLLAYAGSDAFAPKATISPNQAATLFQAAQFGKAGVVAIEADSAQAGFGAENVLDGNPDTIWHTAWGAVEPPYPHHLILDLGQTRQVSGLNLLPRQDMNNGRFQEVAVSVSADGQTWGEPVLVRRLENSSDLQKLSFDPLATRFVKIVATSEVAGRPWASLAELAVVYAKE